MSLSPNQFIMSFLISFIVIIHISQSFSFISPNCYNTSSETINLPEVLVYDAADDVPNYDNNGTVILQKPDNEEGTFGWIGLECSHTKPIRWVYNLDFGDSGLGDSYSQTARVVPNFHDVSTYEFKADVELKIHRRHQTYLLMCVAFENPCERKVVQAYYEPEEELYLLKLLNKDEESQTNIKDLENAMAKNENWGQQNDISRNVSCAVNFSVVDSENSMQHLFQPWKVNVHPRTLPDRQLLENSYLFHEHLNRACVNDFCKNKDVCFNTTKVASAKYWPLVFFMNDKNVSRVVHMYRTLISRNKQEKSPGLLKFAWEYSDPQDFLEMDQLSDTLYLGETIMVNCRVSQFLFSFGTQIGYQSDSPGSNDLTFIKDVEEPADFYDVRVAFGNLTFPSDYKNKVVKIFCFSPVWNSSTEWVNVSRTIELIQPTLEVYPKENSVFELLLNTTFTTSCSASGTPVPKLDLVPPGNTTRVTTSEHFTDNMRQINVTIYNVDESHQGIYKCIATNPKGEKIHQFEIKVKGLNVIVDGDTSLSALTIALISVFGTISAIFLAVILVLLIRFRMEKAEFRRLTEEAIREFFDGVDESKVPPSDADHSYANDGVKLAPYDRKYEVSHKHWSFTGTLLGSGAFGVVQKGFVEMGSRKSVIAIKTVKSGEDIDDFRATLLELKIMSTIGHHRHIVKLIAASTDEINNRKVFIGVEFCANGSLLTYLQKRKKLFTNLVQDGRIEFNQNNEEQDGDHPEQQQEGVYMNLITSDISTIDLYKWSFQIASGMDYLESKKVLHADLAARNILLTEDLLVKISDFGLSRELFENSEYMKKTQVALPWRWMALESLRFLKFSIKSDVWSYGVVLYEVFTLGEEPYSMQTWNEEFVTALDNGMRLDQPPFCTDNVYTKVMTQCWQEEPNNRISFSDAMGFFEKAIGCLTSSPRNRDECRDFC